MQQFEELTARESRQMSQFEVVYDMMAELNPGQSWSKLYDMFDEMMYHMSFNTYRNYLETEISNLEVETDDDEVAQPKKNTRPISLEDIDEVDEHVIQHLYDPAFCVWVEEHGDEYPVYSRVGLYYLYENAMRMLETRFAPYSLKGIEGMEDEFEEDDGFHPYNGEEVKRQPTVACFNLSEHGHFCEEEEDDGFHPYNGEEVVRQPTVACFNLSEHGHFCEEEEDDGFHPYNGEDPERQSTVACFNLSEHGHFRDIEEVFDLSAPGEPPVKVRRISM
jgi:hypothetical protein